MADMLSKEQIQAVGTTKTLMKRKRGRNLIQVREDKVIS